MKIIAVGDLHLASHNISSRKDSYADTCKNKLLFVLRTAIKRKVNVIALTGDIFHDKSEAAIDTSLIHTIYNFLDYCKKYEIKVVLTVGNHDMQWHDPDVSKRNLGLINRAYPDTFILVNQTPVILGEEKVLFTGSSFIFHGDEGELKSRTQYFPSLPDGVSKDMFTSWIHITHGSMIPYEHVGDFQFMDVTTTQDVLAANPSWDGNINGHIHWPGADGRLIRVRNKWSLNPGSLTRGSLRMENLKRTISIYEISVDSQKNFEFTEITVPHQPADVIFDVNAYLEGKQKDKEIEGFIEMLRETSLSETTTNANIERLINESKVDTETKDCAKEYLVNL